MAVQTTEEFKNGGATSYATTIEYLKASDIFVRINGALQTYTTGTPGSGEYSVSGTTVTLGAAAPSGSGNVHIYRETNVNTAAAVFQPGSAIRAVDLNAIHDMARFAAVEHRNKIINADIRTGAVNSDSILDESIVNADISPTADIANTKIADGLLKAGITVNSANIVNGSIVDEDISNSANIQGSKLLDDSVGLTKLGPGTLPNDIVVTTDNIQNGTIKDEDVATNADIQGSKLLDDSVGLTKLGSGSLPTDITVNSANIVNRSIVDEDIHEGTLDNRYYTEQELDGGQLDNRYYTETELNSGQLDNRYYTETEAEGLFLRQDSSETISSGMAWSSTDAKVATTAAIDARIIDLLDDTGGFVPVADETSFPTANPDINNGDGTVVSVKAVSTNLTPSGTTVTIANGAGTGNTVTLTGVTGVIPSGFGMILETTSTLHTYKFHRLQAKATEVNTVATNITQVVACGNNLADIYNFADLYQISTTAPTQRADGTSLVNGDLWFDSSSNQSMMVYDGSAGDGFSPITPTQATITAINNVSGHVTYMEDLGLITDAVTTGGGNNSINTVGANITAVNTVAADLNETTSEIEVVADNIANVNTVGNAIANVNTVAGNNANVTTVATNNANVTTVAGKATEIGRLGTADAVADMNTLGTTATVSDLDTLADISSDITTVAGISSNVTTVSGISSDVTGVAGNNTNITAVKNNETNINAVKNNEANINAVKNNEANINAVKNNETNINAVNANKTNIDTVAGINTDVTAVAGNNSNITAVKNNETNINAVKNNESNINSAVSNASNINTVAGSIADVNRYAAEYVIQSGTPSSPSVGDLWYNSTANALYYWNNSSWVGIQPGIASVLDDATPELAAALDCNDKNLTDVATISGTNLQLDFGTL